MSAETDFVRNIIQAGSSVVISAQKWSIDEVMSLTIMAKMSGATITVHHASAWAIINRDNVLNLAIHGKKTLILDFSE